MKSHGLLYKQWHRQDSSSFLLAGEQSPMLIMTRPFQSLILQSRLWACVTSSVDMMTLTPGWKLSLHTSAEMLVIITTELFLSNDFVFYKCLIWHSLKITQTIHSQVSVSSRYPPCLDSFHGTFSDSNSDIFVPVGTVTLGLGWAIRTTSTTWIEPPGHQRYL